MNLALIPAVIGYFLKDPNDIGTHTSMFLCVFKCRYDPSCTGFFYDTQESMCYLVTKLYSIEEIRKDRLDEETSYVYYEFTHKFCDRLHFHFYKPTRTCFKLSEIKETPDEAESTCFSQNSSLLSLESSSKIVFYNGLADDYDKNIWTSGKHSNGAWKWGSGETITAEGFLPEYDGSHDCLRIHHDGEKWEDKKCVESEHYICERQLREDRELCP